ncbi:MAG: site-2 protease family protein [Thermoprotei archaeon]
MISDSNSRVLVESEVFSRFRVTEEYMGSSGWTFYIENDEDFKKKFKELYFSLREIGYWAFARRSKKGIDLSIIPATPKRSRKKSIYFILFAVTFVSVAVSGYELSMAFLLSLGYSNPPITTMLISTAEFVIALIAILGIHEMGHKFVTERSGERASWPYFIPGPPYVLGAGFLGIGTFGALIMAEEPPLNRDHLFDLGISGPLAGFAVSLIAAAVGVALSPPIKNPLAVNSFGAYYSIFYRLPIIIQLFFAIKGESPYAAALNPILIASWIGMLITFLNLLPAAQLDGGHVFRSFLSSKQAMAVSVLIAFLMIFLGYWLMAILVLFMAFIPDPGALEEVTPLSGGRRAVLLLDFFIIILTAILL